MPACRRRRCRCQPTRRRSPLERGDAPASSCRCARSRSRSAAAGRGCCAAAGSGSPTGDVGDRFIQLTEGVLARRGARAVRARAVAPRSLRATPTGSSSRCALDGGAPRSLRSALARALTRHADAGGRGPAAAARDRVGPRARRSTSSGSARATAPQLDQAGRAVQLGADRRYTGPDCPPEMLAAGGIPQGDCAPVPWLLLQPTATACGADGRQRHALRARRERVAVSTRGGAGPLRLRAACAIRPRPPACAHFCRLTGFPALLPEWGYGFWKSRDVYEHRTTCSTDFEGFRDRGIPLDAIVIDSPWATQYNTWEFNPHQFPDAPAMISRMRAAGRADGGLGDAVGQPRLPRRADPAAARSPSACTASRRRTTRPAPPRATSSAEPDAASRSSPSGGWGPARRSI